MTSSNSSTVPSATRLYRRVLPRAGDGYVLDENRDCLRLSSAVFSGERMSVLLGDTLDDEGREPLQTLVEYPDNFLVAITAAAAREQEQEVERTPLDEEPAHGEVVGKKTKGRKRALAAAAVWIKAPEGLCPEQKIAS